MTSITKYDYIDSLRGIAILMVIICHISIEFHENINSPFLGPIMFMGGRGVQLFYLMSAFTIFLSFSRRRDLEESPVLYFFIRRFFRIAPLFYAGILFYGFILNNGLDVKVLFLMVSFLHGFSIEHINDVFMGSWSIAVEFLFYCTIPYLFFKIKNLDTAIRVILISILTAFLLHAIIRRLPFIEIKESNPFLYFYFPSQFPVFILGIILFFLIIKKDYNLKPITLLFISIFIITHFVLGGKGLFSSHFLISIGFFFFALVLSNTAYPIFVNQFTKFIGKISYSLYVFHMAVILTLKNIFNYFQLPLFDNLIVICITVVVTCVIFAYLTYTFIEVPFINIGTKIINSFERKSLSKI